jgi:hypothetical protein
MAPHTRIRSTLSRVNEVCFFPDNHPKCLEDMRRRWRLLQTDGRPEKTLRRLEILAEFDVFLSPPPSQPEATACLSTVLDYFLCNTGMGYVIDIDSQVARIRMRSAPPSFHGCDLQELNVHLSRCTAARVTRIAYLRYVEPMGWSGPDGYDSFVPFCCPHFYPDVRNQPHSGRFFFWEPAPWEDEALAKKETAERERKKKRKIGLFFFLLLTLSILMALVGFAAAMWSFSRRSFFFWR